MEHIHSNKAVESTADLLGRYQWLMWLSGLALIAFAGVALWQWTPLSEYLDPEALYKRFAFIRESWWAIPLAWGAILIASFAVIPVNLQFLVIGAIFEYQYAIPLNISGAVLAALALYFVGSRLNIDKVLEKAPKMVKKMGSEHLRNIGLIELSLIKFLPLGPFTTTNLFFGALRVSLRNFLGASLISLAPGAVFMSFIGSGLRSRGSEEWSQESMYLTLAGIIGFLLLSLLGKYLLGRYNKETQR